MGIGDWGHGRDLVDVQGDDHQGEEDIGEGHERGHQGGHAGDAAHAADDHETEQEGESESGDERRDVEGVAQRGRYAVGLHGGQEGTVGHDGHDGEQDAEPLEVQSVLDVAVRAAAVGVAVMELVHLGQGGLHKGCGGAEKGDDPHPKYGAGPAEGQGRGHADDVARAHASGEGHAEGLERGDALLGAVRILLPLGEQRADHLL